MLSKQFLGRRAAIALKGCIEQFQESNSKINKWEQKKNQKYLEIFGQVQATLVPFLLLKIVFFFCEG